MEPSLEQGSLMVFSPMIYGYKIDVLNSRMPQFSAPERGDLIVFSPPYISEKRGFLSFISSIVQFLSFGKINLQAIGSQTWEMQTLIKRVIALPGDTVKVQNFTAFIKPSGSDYFLSEFEVIDTSYDTNIGILPEGWENTISFSGNMTELKLEEDQYFVLGDNRMQSSDSSSWGVLTRDRIDGKILMTYWPFNKFKFY
jgi:signal peptidase I